MLLSLDVEYSSKCSEVKASSALGFPIGWLVTCTCRPPESAALSDKSRSPATLARPKM
jgi:hypothetical protein|tara:strand:- start:122 stop:295 length:174 start_codon:yes stop_codon:yes gene_type:complete